MAKFMLILHETPGDFARVSPEEMQRIIEKYTAWGASLAARGHLAGGEKLKEEGGKALRKRGGELETTDGPYSESKEVIGGIYLINAEDYAQAVALASDCPHLEYGRIDVREIDMMGN